MPYRFKRTEPTPAAVRRIATEQIDRSLRDLTSGTLDPHEAIHEARKRFKKIRALLRLVRKPLGKQFRQENSAFRDMGRSLSASRDAEALIETYDKLADQYAGTLSTGAAEHIRAALVARRDRLADEAALQQQVAQVSEALHAARARVEQWPLDEEDFALIRKGLLRTYRDGRKGMKDAFAQRTETAFHEWRKRVKDHWYHATLLRRIWPDFMEGWNNTLDRLSDLLGDHHNLAVFGQTLEAEDLLPQQEKALLFALIEQQNAALECSARTLGKYLYAEDPDAFLKRFESYWNTWRP